MGIEAALVLIAFAFGLSLSNSTVNCSATCSTEDSFAPYRRSASATTAATRQKRSSGCSTGLPFSFLTK